MSQENVEIIKRVVDAFNARDVEAYAAFMAPDVEWFTAMGAVEGEIFRGRSGIDAYFGRMTEAWEEFRGVADEHRDLGDSVIILGRVHARGRASSVQIDGPWACLFDFRGQKISRIRVFLDHAEARRAAGLAE
jgi:ketosteroid isomerase-like protein